MGLLLFFVGLLMSYWIIRLGVAHGATDALRKARREDVDPPHDH